MFDKQSDPKAPSNILIAVPSFTRSVDRDDKNVVIYDVKYERFYHQNRFTELQTQYTFTLPYRYSDLKKFNESLETLKQPLPTFPKTSWFSRVNNDLERIEDRRKQLDQYFHNVMTVKEVRESYLMKNFIRDAQVERDKRAHKVGVFVILGQDHQHKGDLEVPTQLQTQPTTQQQQPPAKKPRKGSQKFTTPAMKAQKEPQFEQRERALSFEHKPQPEPEQERKNSGKSKTDKLKQVTVGGRGLMKGILQNTTKK